MGASFFYLVRDLPLMTELCRREKWNTFDERKCNCMMLTTNDHGGGEVTVVVVMEMVPEESSSPK